MKKMTLLIICFFSAICLFGQIKNYESEGNLECTPGDLKEISEITNEDNPVSIFGLVKLKVEAGEYDDASIAFFVATVYSVFDTKRVKDKSAHQALAFARMNTVQDFSVEQAKKFQQSSNNLMKDQKKLLNLLKKIGYPKYYPKYMIQHGMSAFTNKKDDDGLVENFDPSATWKELLGLLFKDVK